MFKRLKIIFRENLRSSKANTQKLPNIDDPW